MNVRPITVFAYLLLVIAAVVTVVFVISLKPTSTEAAVFFSAWLLLPYFILAILVSTRASLGIEVASLIVTALITSGGLLFLTIVIFVRPDPQGAIAVLFTPLYQGIAMAVLFPLSRWISGNDRSGR